MGYSYVCAVSSTGTEGGRYGQARFVTGCGGRDPVGIFYGTRRGGAAGGQGHERRRGASEKLEVVPGRGGHRAPADRTAEALQGGVAQAASGAGIQRAARGRH